MKVRRQHSFRNCVQPSFGGLAHHCHWRETFDVACSALGWVCKEIGTYVTDEGDWFDGLSGFQEEYFGILLVRKTVGQRKKVRGTVNVVGMKQ